MPPFPKQTSPEYPHQATLQIAITCTPADTQKLQESARRACRELMRLYFTKPNTWFFDRRRAVEAFWCYPDDILLPIAKSELLSVKQRFREYAAVPSTGDNSLHGEVVVTHSLLSDLVSANNCPPLSPARDAFVHWLADDALSGKNTTLRAFVQSTLDNAPRPA